MPDIAALSAPRGAEMDLGRPSWTQSLADHHWPHSARNIGTTRHSIRRTCRLLRAADSDGTCRPPASTRLSPAGQGSDFRQDVPDDDPPMGSGATSECQNSRTAATAGPPARAVQVPRPDQLDCNFTTTLGPRQQPPGRHFGKNLPSQIASSLYTPTCTNNDELDIGLSHFRFIEAHCLTCGHLTR
jgi:hypothetical protein